MAAEETEITLGAGKLLGLFLMLAATCGIFFAVGYSLGKTSEKEQALKSQAAVADNTTSAAEGIKAVAAPAASGATPAKDTAEEGTEPAPNLTFYNAVKQDPRQDAKSTPELKSNQAAVEKAAGNAELPSPATSEPAPATVKAERPSASAHAVPQPIPAGAYLVQIAAVSHEEDAAALAGALRKKSFAASVVNNPAGKDKLFHVVLGPYASLQDAEAMKSKLQGEGYSPIVKR